MEDIALGVIELSAAFEYSVIEYSKKHGLEVNRLMLVICESLKEDIKKGALELMANMSEEDLTKAIEMMREMEGNNA